MSLNTQEKIRCPGCGMLNDVTLWQSITVSDSEDLKKELLNANINILHCSECGAKALIPSPLLYHDEEKKLMFSFIPAQDQNQVLENFNSIKESSKRSGELEKLSGYNLRYISSYNTLLEKILIFDSGLDDRTIEVIKLMTVTQEPDKAQNRSALFGKKHSDGSIEIIIQDKSDGAVFTSRAPASTYDTIYTALRNSGVKTVSYGWEIIDRDYAVKILGA